MCAPEVLDQLLVGRSFLKWVQVCALQVLQQGIPQQVIIGRVSHQDRDFAETRRPTRPQSPLTGDQLEPISPTRGRPHDHRLQQPD
jgi:hypothetical protein